MKKSAILTALLLFSISLFSQVQEHEVAVTNIVVPVRVLDGGRFVDNLKIEDFELYEDGKLQKIEALYLIQKASIERKEAAAEFNPSRSRYFYLLFQMTEYNPKISEAINYFFNNILLPEDTLDITTPMDHYTLSKKALSTKSKDVIAEEMDKIIRKDTQMGASNYRSLMTDLKRIVTSISGTNVLSGIETDSATSMFGLESLLQRYKETLAKMEELRFIDQEKLIKFAEQLKEQVGQKIVFFFYQREFRPEISSNVLSKLMSLNQDDPSIMAELQGLFQGYYRPANLEIKKIIQAFADSLLSFNLIFMNKEPENVSGIQMKEQSEDIFSTFSEVAKATGGTVDTSQNPASGFKNAANISEFYYLIYYSPLDYKKDGEFKSIKVRVKKADYTVIHRLGYYAN
jgi:VWFA-related protein